MGRKIVPLESYRGELEQGGSSAAKHRLQPPDYCGSTIAIALFVMAFTGCAATLTPESASETAASIQEGVADDEHSFAVGILETGHRVAVCSGALLAPNLVVTARHCVSSMSSSAIVCPDTKFGNPLLPSDLRVTTDAQLTPNSSFEKVVQIIVPEGTGREPVCGNDIALLILESNTSLPRYVLPAIEPPTTDHSAYATSVTTIGYSLDSPTDDMGRSIGQRRIKQDVSLVCIADVPQFIDCLADPTIRDLLTPREFMLDNAVACAGDSGSSAYDQGRFERIAAAFLGNDSLALAYRRQRTVAPGRSARSLECDSHQVD